MSKESFKIVLPVVSSSNSGENPCFSCGACCKNNWFDVMSGDELERMSNGSPYIIELLPNPSDPNDSRNRIDEISYIHDDGVRGRRSPREINFTALPFPDSYRVSMIGVCPQLGDDNRCQIYDSRPILCANLPVGGDECNRRRKKAGFSPINQDGIVVEPPSLRQRIGSYAANLRAKLLGE